MKLEGSCVWQKTHHSEVEKIDPASLPFLLMWGERWMPYWDEVMGQGPTAE